MVKKAHLKGRVANHQCCYGNTWYVMMEEGEMEKSLGLFYKSFSFTESSVNSDRTPTWQNKPPLCACLHNVRYVGNKILIKVYPM